MKRSSYGHTYLLLPHHQLATTSQRQQQTEISKKKCLIIVNGVWDAGVFAFNVMC
jgi:hypothetical protein